MTGRLARFGCIVLLFFAANDALAGQLFVKHDMLLNEKLYQLEIADSAARKSQGLMYRQSLAEDAGMLFVYSHPGDYRIWMKNTLIPLSVIWLDQEARIIDMKQLQPCRKDPCPVAAAHGKSMYIIELHPSQHERFEIGDRLPAIANWVVNH